METNKAKKGRLQKAGIQAWNRLLRFLISKVLLGIMIVVGLAVVAWLAWIRAVQPILVEAGLPPGVPTAITRSNVEAASEVGQQRTQRVGHILRDYSRFISVFSKQ